MILTTTSYKGGVGKTTTAIHLAACMAELGSTLLIDSDPNRSATVWAAQNRLPFKVVSEHQAAKYLRDFEHVMIDTPARPKEEDLEALADGCDLLILPATPKALDLDATIKTCGWLSKLPQAQYKVLLTGVQPHPSAAGRDACQLLDEAGIPRFKTTIKRLAAFEKAPLQGVIVRDYPNARSGTGWASYQLVMQEILKFIG